MKRKSLLLTALFLSLTLPLAAAETPNGPGPAGASLAAQPERSPGPNQIVVSPAAPVQPFWAALVDCEDCPGTFLQCVHICRASNPPRCVSSCQASATTCGLIVCNCTPCG